MRAPPPPRLSVAVLIPVLDEEETLRRNLPAALAAADEVVIADGGSRDASVRVARELGARVVAAPALRGTQLNRAAAASKAEVLLFLHADSVLPPGAIETLRRAVATGASGGGFLVRFDARGVVYRLGERVANLRARLTRTPLGDHGQYVTRAAFEALGGYREWPILEDLDLMRRLRRRGRIAVLPLRTTTSARRFESGGPLRTVLKNWWIWTLFALGVSPHRLARLYGNVR